MTLAWLAYSLLGGLAVACAPPGEQVAPLFVPAGLALALIDTWGLWMLVPVALGGFTVDAGAMWGHHVSQTSHTWLLAAGTCGLGAALQAWAGWRWVTGGRRHGLQLDTAASIGRFMLLGAALACLINAGMSVPLLVSLGWIPQADLPTPLMSWWGGDVMGVALGTPIALTLIGRPRHLWRERRLRVGLPLGLAIVLLGVAAFEIGRARHTHEAERFQQEARSVSALAHQQLAAYGDALTAAQSLLALQPNPDGAAFNRMATPWLNRLPGAQALVWLTPTQDSTLERPAPADALQGRLATQLRPAMGWAGWSPGTQVETHRALDRARRDDQVTASALFPSPAKAAQPVVMLFRAVYRGEPYTPQARMVAQVGTLALALDASAVAQSLWRERPAYMGACLIDLASGAQLAGDPDCAKHEASHRFEDRLELGGRTWRLRMWNRAPVPTVTAGLNSWLLTSVGVGFSAALGALLLVMTSHARHLEAARDEAQARSLEAERANQSKSEFMSRMSHELRTPLNAVLGFAQVMEMDSRDPLSPGQREHLSQIQQAGWNLLEMIDDVLDIARLDTGNLRLQTEPIPVGRELVTAHRLFEEDARKARLTLHAGGHWPEHWHVTADASRLRQILGHLLSNAIKFNDPDGEVWLEAQEVSHPTGPMLSITVRDNGHGLKPQQMSQLFQPFNRAGREHGAAPGRGVGLAISRHLAHLMGGELSAASNDDRGATFTLMLPLCPAPLVPVAPAAPEPAPIATPAPGPGLAAPSAKRVLYVEDNQANSEVLRAALADRPWLQLTVADNTESGLAAIHDRVRGGPPDLILLDVHLPDASGLELLGLLKSNPSTAAIPVIMISADALPEQIDAALAAGAACYLTKPVQLTALFAQMDDLLGQARAA
ncbi:MAG: hypothetical protein RI907_2915 [Pseudomonadota bacterium]|jgi:signal transduction histidine kinase/CheY-like chemotaxis protein